MSLVLADLSDQTKKIIYYSFSHFLVLFISTSNQGGWRGLRDPTSLDGVETFTVLAQNLSFFISLATLEPPLFCEENDNNLFPRDQFVFS